MLTNISEHSGKQGDGMSNDEASAWIQECPGAGTVCDSEGIILAMNDKFIRTFQDSGGVALIGSNLFD
ncbi:MAG: hypothetical protein WCC04_10730 [Terriglobales bacterium]